MSTALYYFSLPCFIISYVQRYLTLKHRKTGAQASYRNHVKAVLRVWNISVWLGSDSVLCVFNVPVTFMMSLVSTSLRLVFWRPQYAFQMAVQTMSVSDLQVNIMNQKGNRGAATCNLNMD